jgi:hypothetical protein
VNAPELLLLPPPAPGVLRYGTRGPAALAARHAKEITVDGAVLCCVDVSESEAAEALDALAVELQGGVAAVEDQEVFPLAVLPGRPHAYRAAVLALNEALPFLRAVAEPEGAHTALRLCASMPPGALGTPRDVFDALLQDAVAFARRYLVPPPTGESR